MNRFILPLLILTTGVAQATNPPPKAPPKPQQRPVAHVTVSPQATSKASADASARSHSVASAQQAQDQAQQQTATGGDAAQHQSATGGDAASSANNGGVTTTISSANPRLTPPVFLPAILVADCGAGVNAGGSDEGGAGALGVTWTTDKCYAFKSGSNWAAIGEYEAACVVWKDVNRRAFARQKYSPDCHAIAVRLETESRAVAAPPVPVQPQPEYATKADLERAFRLAVGK